MQKRQPIIQGIVMLLVAASGALASAGPLDNLFVNSKIEADPNKDYQLTRENGPWLVMACSFSGKKAYDQAHDLALELRREYRLPAYLYSKTFEHEVGNNGRGVDRFGERQNLSYMRGNESTEIAVLVGDYPTLEDKRAQEDLERVKNASPECLKLDPNHPTTQNLASWRLFFGMAHDKEKKKGPMWKAFLVANPLLPEGSLAPAGLEKFLVDMNQSRPYTLLKCPGKYTVQVAHFTGRVVIDPKKVQAITNGGDMGNKLEEAGEKAEVMVRALREKGFEAYVFHDRNASIVTVGSFDTVGTPRPDGKTEINRDILRIMQVFGAETTPGGGTKRKGILGIPYDMQPIPVEVPKVSISASYASRGWGLK